MKWYDTDSLEYVWKVQWNALASGGPKVSYHPPEYDIGHLEENADRITDEITIMSL